MSSLIDSRETLKSSFHC